ncbi:MULTISPECIES: HugZ family protein [unclassified Paludibacterium]|uniref:HugZ family pyridoxamine 5'-phosphate oxidase n=1 Tax=unclassified Paludibacterium TaxID=2618429 RepID=UPI001C057565|nr:pyridoxamine 5'-phosphate oxidase family protein [Paludibacterium sp. B53371]BEV70957.1 pyridoxamine 5'-phosphate oxidase family protein [Paludibacterium sp. THUN1379]
MKIYSDSVIQILHECSAAALATHAANLPGFPYASSLSYVPDVDHCPLFLISRLAEHTRNLMADPRASLLIQTPSAEGPETAARLTLIGEVRPVDDTAARRARYVRYLPAAADYLTLGDFTFFRFQPQRARLVAGFGRMGWLEQAQWDDMPTLQAAEEAQLLASLPAESDVLGIDCFGVDRRLQGVRQRLAFGQTLAFEQIPAQLVQLGLRI